MTKRLHFLLAVLLTVVACSSDDATKPLAIPDGCSPLEPETACYLPYPSDFFRTPDSTTATGFRVELLGAAKLRTQDGHDRDADALSRWRADGFSVLSTIVASLPAEVVGDGLPNLMDDPAASVSPSSPTLLLDTSTGKLVEHYVDLDLKPDDPTRTAISLRAFAPLKEKTRYVVALRGVKTTTGGLAPAPEGFRRLRDKATGIDPKLTAVAGRFDSDVFAPLEQVGAHRESLQLAWDFTTGTYAAPTADMFKVRELTLAWLATHTPQVTVTDVSSDGDRVWRWVKGTVTGPLFLDAPGPKSHLFRGADGKVTQNGETTFPFLAMVPTVVEDSFEPGRAFAMGHGFFSAKENELPGDVTRTIATKIHGVLFGLDWWGMSKDDVGVVLADLGATPADTGEFTERVHQGMANWIVMTAAIRGPLAQEDAFKRPASGEGTSTDGNGMSNAGQTVYDTSRVDYYGASEAGMLGTVLGSLDPDLTRLLLNVAGGGFSHMMPRSQPFAAFNLFLQTSLKDALMTQAYVAMLQTALDRIDPAIYAHYMFDTTIPGAPQDRRVLVQRGLGDDAVPDVGGFLLARALGLSMLKPGPLDVFGIPQADPATLTSGFALYDYQVDTQVSRNPVPTHPSDVHTTMRVNPHALDQDDAFLRQDSKIIQTCDGPCDPN